MSRGIKVFQRRRNRVRNRLRKNGRGQPRLSVHRSNKHIYVQVIDDETGKTLASASTLDKDVRGQVASGATVEAAQKVGALVAKRAIDVGVKDVIFDRGGFLYHGRVKAVADSAREAGLSF